MPLAAAAAIIPQSGFSGRPGDGTCRDCHPVKALVPQDSSVILGLPAAFRPETTYRCTLVIRHRGLNEWTFELATADSCGNQAGSFIIADSAHTQVDTLGAVLYLKNTIKGAFTGKPDSARWAFDYVAPPDGKGPVSFYWCTYLKNRKGGEKYYLTENSLTVPEAGTE